MNDTLERALDQTISKKVKATKKLPQIIHNIRIVLRVLNFFSSWLAGQFAFYIYARPRKSKKKLLDPILDSASIFYLPYKAGKLKIYSWGSSKRRVLLMHGWESKATTFREMIPVLVEHGFSVVALDAPAHGGSSGKTTYFIDWGEAVVEVMEYYECAGLPIKNVVSHSFGGSTIFNMLSKGKMELDKFVTISSPFFFHSFYHDFCKLFKVSKKAQHHMLNKMDEILGTPFLDFHLRDEAHRARIQEMMVIHDRDDAVISTLHVDQMREKFDKPTYVETEGLGHYQIIKDTAVIENIARFLINT